MGNIRFRLRSDGEPAARLRRGRLRMAQTRRKIRGMQATEALDPKVAKLVHGWSEYLRAVEGQTPATVDKYLREVRRIASSTSGGPQTLTRQAIEDYLKRLALSGRGVSVMRTAVSAIRSFGRYLVAHNVVRENPARGLRAPRRYRREIGVLSADEVRALVYGKSEGRGLPADPRELRTRVIIAVSYGAALRASEVGTLRTDDLVWNEREATFSILVRGGKWASRDERIPLPVEISRVLGHWHGLRYRFGTGPLLFPPFRGEQALSRWAIARLFAERVAELELAPRGRRLSPHILRHSRVTHLLQEGWDLRSVQALARHSSAETTLLYAHTTEKRLAKLLKTREPFSKRRSDAAPPATAAGVVNAALRRIAEHRSGAGLPGEL